MANPGTPSDELKLVAKTLRECDGNQSEAARRLGMHRHKFRGRMHRARQAGYLDDTDIPSELTKEQEDIDYHALISKELRRGEPSIADLARVTRLPASVCEAIVKDLHAKGMNVREVGSRVSIEKDLEPAYTSGDLPEFVSRDDNTFLFGATSDNHLGSRYERLDVLHDLYDRFAGDDPMTRRLGPVDAVFNAGNWVDGYGRAGFNRNDLKIHGLDEQMAYLAEHYPAREGLTTYAVSGNDHEGWWAQREGIDPGRHAENIMRDHGREDWVNLGYMEAHVRLVNKNTGQDAILAIVHPGGGTGYALSYSTQKIVEALEGGEKPAVAFYGHYHKLWAGNIRNVWVVQTGCTQDQTTFMRSKVKQEAHIGGCIVELEQDPRTGAIIAMTPKIIRYFNQGYYNNRWNMAGPVNLPERVAR